jgi:HSP20 family protein
MNPIDLWSVSPFELMRRMSEEMDRMVQAAPTDAATWIPAVEVAQRDGKLVITAELPGLKEEDVRVEATDEGLVIEGERKREHEETSGGVYRSERSYGFFRRVIALPEEAQVEQAQARFTNGVLEVTVPLSEESSRRRRIPISASAGGGQGSQSEQTGGQGGATGSASTSGGSSTSSNEQAGTRTRG